MDAIDSKNPTKAQGFLLAHLVETGAAWHTDLAMPSGFPVRSTTADSCIRNGWLLPITLPLKLAFDRACRDVAVITPAGRLALKRARPELDTGWSDEDRVKLRETREGRCYGPLEADVCGVHAGELEVFRWTWRAPRSGTVADHVAAIEAGEPQSIRPCPVCSKAYDESLAAELRELGQGGPQP